MFYSALFRLGDIVIQGTQTIYIQTIYIVGNILEYRLKGSFNKFSMVRNALLSSVLWLVCFNKFYYLLLIAYHENRITCKQFDPLLIRIGR